VNRPGDPDRVAPGDLAVELGRLPLALGQAAACMQATGTTLGLALSRLADRRPKTQVALRDGLTH